MLLPSCFADLEFKDLQRTTFLKSHVQYTGSYNHDTKFAISILHDSYSGVSIRRTVLSPENFSRINRMEIVQYGSLMEIDWIYHHPQQSYIFILQIEYRNSMDTLWIYLCCSKSRY